MLETVLKNEHFNALMKRHIYEVINLLLEQGVTFSILTHIEDVSFTPQLPQEIRQHFKPVTLFFLAGYTFESTHVDTQSLQFEAGFGQDNFGSVVSMPLDAILQIIVEEVPLFINLSTPKKEAKKPKDEGVKRSMDALMANPKNQKLFKP